MKALTALLVLAASVAYAQGPPPPPPPPPPAPPSQTPARDLPFLPPVGGGAISGKVVTTDERPAPLSNAIVTLRGDGFRTGWTFVTDATGVFSFTSLPPGRFTLAVTRAGYPALNYGAARPGRPGASIVLEDNTHVTDLALAMPRGAVISGRVLDEFGAPVSGVRVLAGVVTIRNGERSQGFGSSDQTDDRGEYRIFGLAAGDYAIAVDQRPIFQAPGTTRYSAQEIDAVLKGAEAPRPGQPPPAPPRGQDLALTSIYYPSVTSIADASLVHVNAGEERRDVDLHTAYVLATSISGVLADPDGKPPANVILNLTQAGVRSNANFGRPSPVDGTFTFSGLAPGHYVITARATTPANAGGGAMPSLWARTDVDVNGAPVTGVRVTLRPGVAISGSVVFDAAANAAPPPPNPRIALTPVLRAGEVAIGVSSAPMDKERAFAFAGVPDGRYRVDALQSAPGSALWMLKSAVLNGADVLDEPFEVSSADVTGLTVTYTNNVTSILGSLQDASGRPAPDYYIIVFPTDQKYWYQNSRRIKTARPSIDGTYLVRGLPPGSYRIGAVTDVETNDWFESWFLQQLIPASAEITLAEGERKTFPLKIGG